MFSVISVTPRHRLAVARILLGLLFIVRTTPLANGLHVRLAYVHGPLLGWPEPGWQFAWGGIVLPAFVTQAACLVRTVAGVCFTLGLRARWSGIVAGLCGLLVLSQDAFSFMFTFYTLFLGVLLLALTDAPSTLAWRPDPSVSVASSLCAIRVFIGSVYGWAGIAKLHGAWLSGEVLRTLYEDGILSGPLLAAATATPSRSAITAGLVVAGELLLPILLWLPATRHVAVFFALAFHLAFEWTAHPDVIGWVMIILLLPLLETKTIPLATKPLVTAP